MSSLRLETVRGAFWSSVQRFGTMMITFVSNIVLARMLTPDDFGCIGMLMIFIAVSNTFIDGGFGSALIQKKEPSQLDYSTIFFWNIGLSFFIYFLLFVFSPAIAHFYRVPLLSSVLRVQGIVLILNALSIIQQNQLRKKLDFKKLAFVSVSSAVLSLFVAIYLAKKGAGVWSLVAQQLSISLFNALFFWIVSTWRPSLAFSGSSFRSLFGFGGFILLSNLFSAISNEVQGLLVGRLFAPATMGLYSQAYRLETSASTATSSIIDQVSYPVLSSLQDNRVGFIGALRRFFQVPAFICSPIMTLLILVAKPLIILFYSDKWIECVPYFQILCVSGLAVCLQGAAQNAIAAIGYSRVYFKWTIIKRSLTTVLCIIGILCLGMKGLLWSCVLGAWLVYFINAALVARYVGYSFIKQLLDISPYMIISIVIGLLVYYFGCFLKMHGIENIYLISIIEMSLFALSYLAIILLAKLEVGQYVLGILRSKKNN